jgi:hypothetical protein
MQFRLRWAQARAVTGTRISLTAIVGRPITKKTVGPKLDKLAKLDKPMGDKPRKLLQPARIKGRLAGRPAALRAQRSGKEQASLEITWFFSATSKRRASL